ncbi:GNAT family N-acetyltransferase [Streptomyces sp. NPDC048710]|uniref:GNAT family N-acetyltransferase n=1 Tax=unclassified Streptomyces TaxID=2593676 RepID=UPI003719A127
MNVAYGLSPSWRGRGLATRAVPLACRYAAGEGGVKAMIQVEPENPASAVLGGQGSPPPGRRTARTAHASTGTSGTCVPPASELCVDQARRHRGSRRRSDPSISARTQPPWTASG